MSRPLIASLSPLLLAATLAAQPEGIQIYPASGFGSATNSNGTTFATRLSFGTGTGEAIVQYPKTHFEGIGDNSVAGATGNPACSLHNWSIYLQDQNTGTSNNFSVAVRPAASGGGPDTNNTNALYVQNFSTPTTTTSGAGTWRLWLVTPINRTIPCQADLFFGVKLNANSNWPTSDGLSVWTAYYDPKGQNATFGDAVAPRTGVPNLAWEISSSGSATQPTIPQILDYVLLTQNSSLQVGVRHKTGQSNHGTDDGFGVAALYPDITGGTNGRQDGLLVRITDNPPGSTPVFGGQYLLFASVTTRSGLSIPPTQLIGLLGSVYLGPVGFLPLGGGALSSSGPQTVVALAPPASIPADFATNKVKVYFQAATQRGSPNPPVVAITNMAAVYY